MSERSIFPGRDTGTCTPALDLMRGIDGDTEPDDRPWTSSRWLAAERDHHDHDLIHGEPHGADCPWCTYRRLHPDKGATPNGLT